MKIRHFLTTFALISIPVFILISGCVKYDEWEFMSAKIYSSSPKSYVCRHRVAMIAKRMMEEGKAFDIVIGTCPWSSTRHVRIEYWSDGNMKILDPTWPTKDMSKFVEDERWSYDGRSSADRRVISNVNRWLVEIGLEPYRR